MWTAATIYLPGSRPGPPYSRRRWRTREPHLPASELRKFSRWLAHSTGPMYVANSVRSAAGKATYVSRPTKPAEMSTVAMLLEFPWNTGRDGDSMAASDCKEPLAAMLTVVWTHRSPAPTHCFLSRADAGRAVPLPACLPPRCRAVSEYLSSLRKRTTCLLTNCTNSESPKPVCVRQMPPAPGTQGPCPTDACDAGGHTAQWACAAG